LALPGPPKALSNSSRHVVVVWLLSCALLPLGFQCPVLRLEQRPLTFQAVLDAAALLPLTFVILTSLFGVLCLVSGICFSRRVRGSWRLLQVCMLAGWFLGGYYSNRIVFVGEALFGIYLCVLLYAREVREEFGVLAAPREAGVLLVLLGMCALLALLRPEFVATKNFLNMLRQYATVGVMAVGMTLVIVLGGIDLSIGSIVALAGCLATMAFRDGASLPVAILIALVVGGATGAFNGGLTSYLRINPFIITLGTMSMARSLANVITSGTPVVPGPERAAQLAAIATLNTLGVPNPVWLMAIVVVIGHVFLTRTRTGRHIYYIGANEEAARLSGVNVLAIKWLVYALCGLLAGLAAIIQAARVNATGQPTAGMGDELRVIAAVIIGGASFTGGEGTVLGALVGTVILGVLSQGLVLLEVPSYWQKCVEGAVIIGAVAVDVLRRRVRR